MKGIENRWVLAFDVGGQSTKIGLVSEEGSLEQWSKFPTEPPRGDLFLDLLSQRLCELREQASVPLVGIGGAVAGFLDAKGALLYNPNLAWLEGTGVQEEVARRVSLPTYLENDANAACAGESLFGCGRGSERLLCVTGGTGVGVGMIVNGEFVRAAFGGLGDAGHVIVERNGPSCSCGGRGCAEAVLSTVTLAWHYSALVKEPRSFRDLVEAGRMGEAAAVATLRLAGEWLGVLLASLAHIFFPDRIAIAGGLSEAGDTLLGPARASFADHAGTYPASSATIVSASAGAQAPLLGAAACVFLKDRR